MPRKGYKQTEEHRKNIGISGLNRLCTNTTKQKISNSLQNKYTVEKLPVICQICHTTRYFVLSIAKTRKYCTRKCYAKEQKDKPLTEKHKRNLSKNHADVSGKNNHFWKGGITSILYPKIWTNKLKESIRLRDNYICQECGIHQDDLEGWNKKLDVHHIDYNKENCDPDNLISLCKKCHMKTNSNRKYWKEKFNTLLHLKMRFVKI